MTPSSEPPTPQRPELVTRAEYERRLKRARMSWWAAVLFFGGGAASAVGIAITQRHLFEPPALGGLALVVLFALQRLIYVLRRRPK